MMEASFSLFFVVLVIAPSAVQPTSESDVCKPVLEMLDLIKSTIDYDRFCEETPSGGDKLACRINGLKNSFGFLVCKKPTVGQNKPCRDFINGELGNLRKLQQANIKTVGFFPYRIDDVRCGRRPMVTTCSGFVEKWVTKEEGEHEHIRLAIAGGKAELDRLIQNVIELTTQAGGSLVTTADDIFSIRNYMVTGLNGRYRQVCDLQGFFLKAGGFQVSDTEGIIENLAHGDRCGISDTSGQREPTTKEVLDALLYMGNHFGSHAHNFPQTLH